MNKEEEVSYKNKTKQEEKKRINCVDNRNTGLGVFSAVNKTPVSY